MGRTIEINITEDETLFLEKYFFEMVGTKTRYLQFISEEKFPIEQELIDQAYNEYILAFTANNLSLAYVAHDYFKKMDMPSNYEYSLDFSKQMFIVEEIEKNKNKDSCESG